MNDINLFQPIEDIGSCVNLYMFEADCKSSHGECVNLTVDCNVAKLASEEVDDLDSPVYEEKSIENRDEEGNITDIIETVEIIGYNKKNRYFTVIDEIKELAQQKALANIEIIKEIELLESTITPRRLREAILSGDTSFIESVEQQISTLRNSLEE